MSISYTFPADCPVPQLRGVTCEGGVFSTSLIDRKLVDVCVFATLVDGKTVTARVAGKPELMAALAAHKASIAQAAAAKRAMLEAAVPGLAAYEAAMHTYSNAIDAYDRASERGYPVREAQAAKLADEALQAVHAEYPATAMWREIVAYEMASNDCKGSAGNTARKAVLAGTPIADAVATMRAEWSAAAERAVWNS